MTCEIRHLSGIVKIGFAENVSNNPRCHAINLQELSNTKELDRKEKESNKLFHTLRSPSLNAPHSGL